MWFLFRLLLPVVCVFVAMKGVYGCHIQMIIILQCSHGLQRKKLLQQKVMKVHSFTEKILKRGEIRINLYQRNVTVSARLEQIKQMVLVLGKNRRGLN
jgi:hypothetical protein